MEHNPFCLACLRCNSLFRDRSSSITSAPVEGSLDTRCIHMPSPSDHCLEHNWLSISHSVTFFPYQFTIETHLGGKMVSRICQLLPSMWTDSSKRGGEGGNLTCGNLVGFHVKCFMLFCCSHMQ